MVLSFLKGEIGFPDLAGHEQPDGGTVVSDNIKSGGGFMTLENYFLDGTKIEVNANKYKWVWAKSKASYRERLQEKNQELLEKIERENDAEQEGNLACVIGGVCGRSVGWSIVYGLKLTLLYLFFIP
jgi:hypothetical protein